MTKALSWQIPLLRRIEIAQMNTYGCAFMKDWRVRNKRNRAMREIARELVRGKGYIIASVRELRAKYGDLCHYEPTAPDADRKTVWCVMYNEVFNKLLFAAI